MTSEENSKEESWSEWFGFVAETTRLPCPVTAGGTGMCLCSAALFLVLLWRLRRRTKRAKRMPDGMRTRRGIHHQRKPPSSALVFRRFRGSIVGSEVGISTDGKYDSGGSAVGCAVGSTVGCAVGSTVGCEVGSVVGSDVGSEVGSVVGSEVGPDVGSEVGPDVGSLVGSEVGCEVGSHVGSEVGADVGAEVGSAVGSDVHMSTTSRHSVASFAPVCAHVVLMAHDPVAVVAKRRASSLP